MTMTSFELAIILIGVIAIAISWDLGQKMCRTWSQHSQRQEARQEKMHIELMAIHDQLRAIKESFQRLDNN